VGNRIVGRIFDFWRRLYVIVVRVEVACGIGVNAGVRYWLKVTLRRLYLILYNSVRS
jgi:hypothetical protein